MRTSTRHLTSLAVATALAVGTAVSAHAVTATFGNDVVERGLADTFRDFVIVDTNTPAPFDGTIERIDYWAQRPGDIRFVLVDPAGVVTWVGPVVTATTAGPRSVTLDAPVGLVAGTDLGVYSVGTGVVSWQYDDDAAPAPFTPNASGLPAVGDTLGVVADSRRVYSMRADVRASSPEVCKDGGWERYGHRNQGQCIASVVANERAGKG